MKNDKDSYPFAFFAENNDNEYENIIHLVIYSKINNTIIGFIKGYFIKNNKNIFWLQIIVIDKEYQNKGVGTEAYNYFEKYLIKEYNIKKIMLTVIDKNIGGMEFWKNNKFIPIYNLQILKYINIDENVILYQKNL